MPKKTNMGGNGDYFAATGGEARNQGCLLFSGPMEPEGPERRFFELGGERSIHAALTNGEDLDYL
jgi:hypothetical protein